MHGAARERMEPFSIPKPGWAWLRHRTTAVRQQGSSETPTASFHPILGSSPCSGPIKGAIWLTICPFLGSPFVWLHERSSKSLSLSLPSSWLHEAVTQELSSIRVKSCHKSVGPRGQSRIPRVDQDGASDFQNGPGPPLGHRR